MPANPAAATFRDSFATSVLSACWAPDGSPHGNGPGLVLAADEDVYTNDAFDLTNSVAWVKWAAMPGAGGEARLDLLTLTGPFARISYVAATGLLRFFSALDFTTTTVLYAGELDWRFRYVPPDLLWETSADGGATWSTRRNQNWVGQGLEGCVPGLVSNGAGAVVTSYNGGGVPHCPTVPGPPPFVPVDGAPIAQSYTWRDAKGFTAITATYLLGTVAAAAAAAAALRPLLEACSDAALVHAEGPYYVDRFAYGASAHGAAIGDQLVISGVGHRTGTRITLVVPAATPSLFTSAGLADVTSGAVGALADYWQRHGVTRHGEGFAATGARRGRGHQRTHYRSTTRRPTLGGPGL